MSQTKTLLILISLFVLSLQSELKGASTSCISPENKAVDWSIIYTLPKKATGDVNKYIYIDNTKKEFKEYDAEVESFPPNKIAMGLNSLETTYVIWNDDATNGEDKPKYDEKFAHSKGLLSFNNEKGVYIIHSLPRFPLRDSKGVIVNEFASNFGYYGQTFFCMSVNHSEVDKIINALLAIRSQVLLYNISSGFKNTAINKKIEQLLSEEKNIPQEDVTKIKTAGGLEIDLFVESHHEHLPWDTNIPEYYKDNFYVETWTRPKLLPNVCTKGKGVYNIESMKMSEYTFANTEDHSKWGASVNKNIICYGDLNRTDRSGKKGDRLGTIACFENNHISNVVKELISTYEKCEENTMKFLES